MRIILSALLTVIAYFAISRLLHIFEVFFQYIMMNSEYCRKRDWILSHKGQKEIEYKSIDIYNPKRGWSIIPDLRDRHCGDTIVSSNSDGVRGREEFSANKETALFFGDSFCFGEDVKDQETIPYFFGERIGSLQSVNFGVHGYGIDQQYLYLKEAAARYRPNLICFIISFDNFNRCFLTFRDYAKPRFVLEDGGVILKNNPVPEPEYYLKTLKAMPFFPVIPDFFRQTLIYYGLIGRNEREKICSYILEMIRQAAADLKANLIFLYIPNFLKDVFRNYVDDFFIGFFKERGVTYLNLGDIYTRSELRSMVNTSGCHFNAEGNSIVADRLVEFVKSYYIS